MRKSLPEAGLRVLLNWQASESEITRFRAALPGDTIFFVPAPTPCYSRFDCTLDAIKPVLSKVDAIVGWVLPAGALGAAKNLKLLCWMHAGCDELDLRYLKSMQVKVTNIRGANSTAVAEHAIALILGVAKRLISSRQSVVDADTSPFYVAGLHSAMLDKRTIGIIGFGQIGTEIARQLKAFNMRVLAVRRHPDRTSECADAIYGTSDLHQVLRQCDYVVLSAPLDSRDRKPLRSTRVRCDEERRVPHKYSPWKSYPGTSPP